MSLWTRRIMITVLFLVLPYLAWPTDSGYGSVEGVVRDGQGKPLAAATIFVANLARAPRTQTDEAGRFKLDNVPVGHVSLSAFKEIDGYPYDMFSFFAMPGKQMTRFDLASGEVKRNVVIRLGAKAAYLRMRIADEKGDPISAELSFSRPDLGQYGDYRRGSAASERILVPPVPFRITVEAPGYESWHYGGVNWLTQKGLIHLRPGKTLTLFIHLHAKAG